MANPRPYLSNTKKTIKQLTETLLSVGTDILTRGGRDVVEVYSQDMISLLYDIKKELKKINVQLSKITEQELDSGDID